jgi:hypothetical protein
LAGSNNRVYQSRELRDLHEEKENQPGFFYAGLGELLFD